jgi:uncharacterized protein (DUF1786 family)
MSRFLCLDIGAGTLDVLYYNSEEKLPYKAVVRSPVRVLADRIASQAGDLIITGREMGGGPTSQLIKERAQTAKVTMSRSAAATVHHDIQRVRSFGIEVVDDDIAQTLARQGTGHWFISEDLECKRLERIVRGLGVPYEFDAVAICAQDHGVPPQGISHLDYRHKIFQKYLDKSPFPADLLFSEDEVPASMNRLGSIAASARELPAKRVYVMDSGMAAVLGAGMDMHSRARKCVMVLDVATSHTVAAVLEGGAMAGFFEYHTHDVVLKELEQRLIQLAEGRLSHEQILGAGGHGAYLRKRVGFDAVEVILATGPKRRLLKDSKLDIVFGAPWGDNMMTGTVGLLEAVRRREELEPIDYI